MKRKLWLLLLLLGVSEVVASTCSLDPDTKCCERGKRGRRGRRGPVGRDAQCGLGEIFLNAQMMYWAFEIPFPPNAVLSPYAPTIDTFLMAWVMPTSVADPDIPFIGGNFNIPIDLDRTQPVTVIVDILVDSSNQSVGNQAKLEIVMDYQGQNGLIGFTPPATGFADTQLSPDFAVNFAIPVGSNNLRHVSVEIPLDITQIDGDWAFVGIRRIAPAANEYSSVLYLSAVSIQYSRICS